MITELKAQADERNKLKPDQGVGERSTSGVVEVERQLFERTDLLEPQDHILDLSGGRHADGIAKRDLIDAQVE